MAVLHFSKASVVCGNEIFVKQKSANRLSKVWKALQYAYSVSTTRCSQV